MLLRAGMAAPTAVNKQPWHFVVINDRAKLDELGGNGRQSQMWQESTLAIAVCGNMDKALEGPAQAFWPASFRLSLGNRQDVLPSDST